MNQPPAFLASLLDAAGPSGFEVDAARLWRAEAETFADSVTTDVSGNTIATVNPDGRPRIMLAGHIDEIGLQVTHIDEDGFLYIAGIGGWDPQVLVGQRVKILGSPGGVVGVVGKKAIHLLKVAERKSASQIDQLWVDVGVGSRAEATELGLRGGDAMVIDAAMVSLAGDRIASRAIDNRIGAYVVLEALRLLSDLSPTASRRKSVADRVGEHAAVLSAWNRTPLLWSTSLSAPMYRILRRSSWASTIWEEAQS